MKRQQNKKENKFFSEARKNNDAVLRQQIEQLMMQCHALTVQNQELSAQNQELFSQNQQLRQGLIQSDAEAKALQGYNTTLQQQNLELWEKNEKLKSQMTFPVPSMTPYYPFTPFLPLTPYVEEKRSEPFASNLISIKRVQPDTFEDQVLKLMVPQNLKKGVLLDSLKIYLEDEEESGEYFNQFIPYIIEEVRAQINQQLEIISRKNLRPFKASLQALPFDEKEEEQKAYVTLTYNTKELPKLDHGFYLEAVLVVIKEESGGSRRNLQEETINGLAAIAAVTHQENERKAEFSLKIRREDYLKYRSVLKKNPEIWIHWLGGLVPSSRMYQVCVAMPTVSFESQFIRGRLEPWPALIPGDSPLSDEKFHSLNPSQRNAVQRLQQAESGLYCLQGPPGTGKTITVRDFLIHRATAKLNERILACAPSNQAVRVLLNWVKAKQPKLLIALIGYSRLMM